MNILLFFLLTIKRTELTSKLLHDVFNQYPESNYFNCKQTRPNMALNQMKTILKETVLVNFWFKPVAR